MVVKSWSNFMNVLELMNGKVMKDCKISLWNGNFKCVLQWSTLRLVLEKLYVLLGYFVKFKIWDMSMNIWLNIIQHKTSNWNYKK